MQRASTRNPPQRSSGGERVFTDDEGRLWSAALEERDDPAGALVFRCISDGRQAVRALAVDPIALFEAGDDTLRARLRAAPPVGPLAYLRREARACESIGDRRFGNPGWSDTERAARPVWSKRSPSCPAPVNV